MIGRRRRGLKLCRFFGYVSKIGPQSGLPARWWDDLDGALHVDGSKCYRGGSCCCRERYCGVLGCRARVP